MKFYYRYFIYFLIILVPVFFRLKWNDASVFISSDPQIKYYQVIGVIEGNSPESCYFPAKKLGFPLEMIPIGYPWAFFLENGKCVFQYPVLFVWIQKIFGFLFSNLSLTYIPIFFFFLNFLILDKIIQEFENRSSIILIASILIQCFSPIFLSALDYSELTLTNFFLLVSVYSYLKFQTKANAFFGLLLALCVVLNFQLRPESTITLLFFLSASYLLSNHKLELLKQLIPYICLAILLQVLFFYWNHSIYGHVLGMRGLNTFNDIGSDDMKRNYLVEWIADLWGNEFKIGIFKGYPILFLSPLALIWKKKSEELFPFFIAGLFFIILLPILSPYRAGVDIFGMRYYESGVYLILIATVLTLLKHSPKLVSFFVILPFLYFSYKSDTRATKQWSSSSKLYHEMVSEIQKVKPDLIVHRGLSLSYLMGDTYITYPQVAVYSNGDWLKLEEILKDKKISVLFLQWEGNRLVNDEFPSKIWKEKFDINFQLKPNEYQVTSEHKIAHFQGFLLEKKR
ncbi:Hypothetical protein LBF_1941 [Leptospira biflexa serovar Patoc strain 'Patoc 1 (Ames)']|uniref:Glycosyltransferase RgtA/B/C/D-like domain-containing protein n=1 Tax=Leptospira biflexa serovar Patoc (strain Patoc 1 / ATCC 23582 / Paris) TaxID=456481 RepID=B0SSK5_LEPBP|nr:hypothetical protein [Leptospira biflexa]ABZ94443.1 Hypothetical protein LBF_1941 [Leptospira biflexa serovar Patoc strain 'Patoc 1 (Ames)']ABZ98095.1 Conserved hypothetical protein; putative membrane protein [Leptospira biflexa serovar Patoc strain 'Patoc 1 (Paris)']